MLSRPEIKTAEQLKGDAVAISRFGSASDFQRTGYSSDLFFLLLRQKRMREPSPKTNPTIEGIKTILEPLKNDPKAKSAKPQDFVDMRFIKELDDSGYIDGLSRGR